MAGQAANQNQSKMNRSHFLVLGLAVVLLPACNEATAVQNDPCDPFLLEYGAAAGDTVTTEEGVRYIEIEAGTGSDPASLGDIARVNYSGYRFVNEQLFDTSCLENRAAIGFQLGTTGIIPGFSLGVVGMRMGGVRRIILPSELAYNDGEDLIFDLHLVELN